VKVGLLPNTSFGCGSCSRQPWGGEGWAVVAQPSWLGSILGRSGGGDPSITVQRDYYPYPLCDGARRARSAKSSVALVVDLVNTPKPPTDDLELNAPLEQPQ
jgi:hypothetical protein